MGSPVTKVARHAHSALLAVACDDLTIRIFDVEVRHACYTASMWLQGNTHITWRLWCNIKPGAVIDPYTASMHDTPAASVQALSLVRRFEGHSDRITDLVISSNCRWLLSASMDGTLRVWDIPAANSLQV